METPPPRSVLIIEDDPTFRKALVIALRQRGHRVFEAADGAVGLRIAAAEPIDLVLTDLIMPQTEGLETIFQLRRSRPGVPVFAMSGGGKNSPGDYLRIATAMGALRVFAKPFELDEVCAAIGTTLHGR